MQQITNAEGAAAFNRKILANLKYYMDLMAEEFRDYDFHFKLTGQWNGETQELEKGYFIRLAGIFVPFPADGGAGGLCAVSGRGRQPVLPGPSAAGLRSLQRGDSGRQSGGG